MSPPVWERPLGKLVGSGGFAAVWEIAGGGVLKVAHADHELARARLHREADALVSIAAGAAKRGMPCVPIVEGHGVFPDGRAWIAMERVAGTNLADLIAAGTLRVSHATGLAIGIADALAQIHAAGWVHRDIKPDNLVRRTDGRIAILDLGLARKFPDDPDDPTRAGVQVGSLEYIPPEQLLDAASVDPRADLYALGCVLYEMCAGRPPFIGDANALERAHAALRPPPLGALAQVPAGVEALCHELLAKQPPRRPPDAATVAARLRDTGYEPSLQRQHSMSTIREGKQPVVLLWAELPRVDRSLLVSLTGRRLV
ncbi:MAG: serine/threonine protein kinase, partial [Deltaproteobacteria bacterium]|nr:serine/threonine protein kinase [Deltaproteobacteria bacterium]